jgi:exoribonuclease R
MLQKYKILINDRNYSSFSFVDYDTNEIIPNEEINTNPIENKLFNKDIFTYNTNNITITKSDIRNGISIPGVLLLENNKTFGRTKNKKRLLYKCIPDDKHLPIFLIPYEIEIQFSKVYKNKYVLFKFENWDNKHPNGILVNTIGNVDNLDVFYEYQLYCKNINISLANFTKKTREQIQIKKQEEEYIHQILHNKHFNIHDRRSIQNIFTIDPNGSTDFDDAISIEYLKKTNQYKISVYISNVYVWLETLDLWKYMTASVSTIYLPNRRKPMLPAILSDNLCSLKEGDTRFAFCMDMIFEGGSFELKSIEYNNVAIIVKKNYKYDEEALIRTHDYSLLLSITKKLDKSIVDSHDVVAYWMIKMNTECGNYMANQKMGIFRLTNYINAFTPLNILNGTPEGVPLDVSISHLENNTQRIIKSWSNSIGKYVVYDDGYLLEHEIMKTVNYIHITSPIRRLIDILNQIWISKSLGIIRNISENCENFVNEWKYKLDYINSSMRSIRKIQTDSQLMCMCFNNEMIMNTFHNGVLFDKVTKENGYIEYMVYLEGLKMLGRIKTTKHYDNYTNHMFKIFLFKDEYNVKKKIRLQFAYVE